MAVSPIRCSLLARRSVLELLTAGHYLEGEEQNSYITLGFEINTRSPYLLIQVNIYIAG